MSNKWPLLKNRGEKARVNSKWPLWEENANEEPVVFNPHSYNYKPENKIKNNFLEHKEEPQVLVVGCGGESQLSSPAGVWEDHDLEARCAETQASGGQLSYIFALPILNCRIVCS